MFVHSIMTGMCRKALHVLRNKFIHSPQLQCPLHCRNLASTVTDVLSTEVKSSDDIDALYRVVEVEVRGHDPAVLKSYEWFAVKAAKELDIKVDKTWVPPKHFERYTLLKSVHVHRKHLVQYEMRTHFRVMQLKHLTGSTADTYLEYIQRNLPEGVAMKVTKHAIERLPESLHVSNIEK